MVSVEERVSLIQQIGLLQSVDPTELQRIAQQMTESTFEDGDVVFHEYEPGDRLYLIFAGNMHVYVERESSIITYGHLQVGACFGEMALLEDAPRSATVKSEGASLCLTLSKEEFLDLMNRNPNMALGIIRALVGHLRRSNVQLLEYARRLTSTSDEKADVDSAGYDLEGIYDQMFRVFGTLI